MPPAALPHAAWAALEARYGHFMALALGEAQAAEAAGEVPIGAVLVAPQGAGWQVLARAHNQVERLRDATAHAEMLALTSAMAALGGKYLPECALFVTVEPCVMCAGALRWAQVGAVVWGAADEKFGFLRHGALGGPTLLHPRTRATSGVEAGRCAALMQAFFQARRT